MQKIKINFEYTCEIEIKPEEIKGIKQNNPNSAENIALITYAINEIFLSDDGRTEVGEIINFHAEIVNDSNIN